MSLSVDTSGRIAALLELEAVRAFFIREALLLDSWRLTEWAALFTDDGSYLVEPMGDDLGDDMDPARDYYVLADDRARIDQRVERLGKVSAHAEYPHSTTRHLFTNVRITASDAEQVKAELEFITFRTRRRSSTHFVGTSRYQLVRSGPDDFRIRRKAVQLAHETLFEQGKVSIIL